MDTPESYELIEQYLEGNLSNGALSDFKQQLNTNPNLARRVQLFQDLNSALGNEKVLRLQAELDTLGQAFFPTKEQAVAKTRTIPFYRRPSFAVAASFLVLFISAVLWWQISSGSPSGTELYAQHFDTYALSDGVRGNQQADLYTPALQAYQQQDFTTSSRAFQQILQDNPADRFANFGLAQAYLNTQPASLDKAQAILQTIAEDSGSLYQPKAQWYLALIYLQQDNQQNARPLLEAVIRSRDSKGEAAKKILEELD